MIPTMRLFTIVKNYDEHCIEKSESYAATLGCIQNRPTGYLLHGAELYLLSC